MRQDLSPVVVLLSSEGKDIQDGLRKQLLESSGLVNSIVASYESGDYLWARANEDAQKSDGFSLLDEVSNMNAEDSPAPLLELLVVCNAGESVADVLTRVRGLWESKQPTPRIISALVFNDRKDDVCVELLSNLQELSNERGPLFSRIFLIDDYDVNDRFVDLKPTDRLSLISMVARVIQLKQHWANRIFGIGAAELLVGEDAFKRSLWIKFIEKIARDHEVFKFKDSTPSELVRAIAEPPLRDALPPLTANELLSRSVPGVWQNVSLEDLTLACYTGARNAAAEEAEASFERLSTWIRDVFSEHGQVAARFKALLALLIGETPAEFGGESDTISLGLQELVYLLVDDLFHEDDDYMPSAEFRAKRREIIRIEGQIAKAHAESDWVNWVTEQIKPELTGFRVGDRYFQDSGYIPEPPDFSLVDYVPDADVEVPPIVDLRSRFPAIGDQGNVGACTAYATIAALEFHAGKHGHEVMDLSEYFLYYEARAIAGTGKLGEGSSFANAIKALKQFGICDQAAWPNDSSQVDTKPHVQAYEEAERHRLTLAKQVPAELHALRAALAEGYPILIGVKTSTHFERNAVSKDGFIPVPQPSELRKESGHAMLIVGYDSNQHVFIVRNSWGKGWGDEGYCYMDEKYILSQELCHSRYILCEITDWVGESHVADLQHEGRLEFNVRERASKFIAEQSGRYLQELKSEHDKLLERWLENLEFLRNGGFSEALKKRQIQRDAQFAKYKEVPAEKIQSFERRIGRWYLDWPFGLTAIAALVSVGMFFLVGNSSWLILGAVLSVVGLLVAWLRVRRWNVLKAVDEEQLGLAFEAWHNASFSDAYRTKLVGLLVDHIIKRKDHFRLCFHDISGVVNQFAALLEEEIGEQPIAIQDTSQFKLPMLDERALTRWWKRETSAWDWSEIPVLREDWLSDLEFDTERNKSWLDAEFESRAKDALMMLEESEEWKKLGEHEFNVLDLISAQGEERVRILGAEDNSRFEAHLTRKSKPLVRDVWRTFPRSMSTYLFRPSYPELDDVQVIDQYLRALFNIEHQLNIDTGRVTAESVLVVQVAPLGLFEVSKVEDEVQE